MLIKNSERGQGQLLLVVILLILCGVVAGAYSWMKDKAPTNTTDGQVTMLQPVGVNSKEDHLNSQTNLNNSEANLNNANARAIPSLTAAEVELKQAEACKLRNDCAVKTYLEGQEAGEKQATMDIMPLLIVGGVVAGMVLLMFRKGDSA